MRWGTGNCGPEQLSGSTGTESPEGVKSGSQVGAAKLETLAAKLGKRVEPEAQGREDESECFEVRRPHSPEVWGQMRGQSSRLAGTRSWKSDRGNVSILCSVSQRQQTFSPSLWKLEKYSQAVPWWLRW